MKTLLCLAALVILTTAYPTAVVDQNDPNYSIYKYYYDKYVPEPFRYDVNIPGNNFVPENFRYGSNVLGGWGKGDSACDRQALSPADVISQRFYDSHICLIRKTAPKDLSAFCRDFRQGQPIYQVMLLTAADISRLRSDLKGHQQEFYNDRYMFRPLHRGQGQIHYTTDETYTFIYCEESKKGKWVGKQKSGRYQQYIPHGTDGDPKGVYKIYHGCPPVTTYPGFSQPGPC